MLRGIDQDAARRIPPRSFQGSATSIVDRIAALGQAKDRWQEKTPASDRETVLQLPEQSFYPAGTQIGGSEIDRSLIFQLGMGRGEKALGFLG